MRRAMLAFCLASAGAAAVLACASAYNGAVPSPDAAIDGAATPDEGADVGSPGDGASSVAFCQSAHAGVLICDDFEGPVEPSPGWTTIADGGRLEITTVSGHDGHVMRMTADQPDADLRLALQPTVSVAQHTVALELDFLVSEL